MKLCGILPKHQVLDNEVSKAYKDTIQESVMTYQLVPPDYYQLNITEKSIQTWKAHFIAVISGTAANFPIQLWCQLIPQTEKQLLMLGKSQSNPKISSYAHLNGTHNYSVLPFLPIGMEALIHEKPTCRKIFAEHCKKVYVLGTSYEHYRCWNLWINETRTPRVSGTVFFKHKYITNPTVTPKDADVASAANIADALKNKIPHHLQ